MSIQRVKSKKMGIQADGSLRKQSMLISILINKNCSKSNKCRQETNTCILNVSGYKLYLIHTNEHTVDPL